MHVHTPMPEMRLDSHENQSMVCEQPADEVALVCASDLHCSSTRPVRADLPTVRPPIHPVKHVRRTMILPNQSVERTGMSRAAQGQLLCQRRLIPVAHLWRSAYRGTLCVPISRKAWSL